MNVKCYPICKCGYVFKKLSVHERLINVSENYSKMIKVFEPNCCPRCKESIEGLEVPRQSYFGSMSFDYDEDSRGGVNERD